MKFRRLEIRQRIKEKAKIILTGSLMPIIKLCLLLTGIFLVVEYIKLFAAPILTIEGEGIAAVVNAYLHMSWQQILSIATINVLAVIVIGPLLCSFCMLFLRLTPHGLSEEGAKPAAKSMTGARSKEENLPDLGQTMSWFTNREYRNKAIILRAATTLLSVMWHVILCGPPIYYLYHLRGNTNSFNYANSMMIYLTWMLLGFLLAYVKVGTYYPAYFLIAQDQGMSIPDAIRDSIKMMNGHAWEFLLYKLSFLPWYVLAGATFGIGLLYVVPYRGICDALFVRYIDTESSGENPF